MSPKRKLTPVERATKAYFENLSPEARKEENELAALLGSGVVPNAATVPNRATRAAIEAGERGRVSRAPSVKAMMEELDADG